MYPKFWGHWAFIYSRYCSYSSLIHNDVLPTTRHVSEVLKLFDVGEIFFFCLQRRNKTLGTRIMSAWLIFTASATWTRYHLNLNQISLLTNGGFCQLAHNDWTHRSIFTLSAKFCFQESRSSEQFLEGHKQPRIFFEQRSKILYSRLFNFFESTFRSREGGFVFFKVNTRAHANWIYDREVYLPWYKAAVTNLVAFGSATLAFSIFICWSFFTLFCFSLPLL